MKHNKLIKKGFTLIEVLVVVLIIGILTSVALPQYQKAVEKSRAVEGMTLAKAVGDAEQVFYSTYNRYTKFIDELDLSVPASTKHWEMNMDFATDSDKPIVYTRSADTSYDDRWYIYYTLKDGRLWCGARSGNDKTNKTCRSLGSKDYEYCTPAGEGVRCYPIE